jgi:uncharacterized protein YegP (UPF0339 family)
MAALMADARMEASIRADERALGARAHGRADLAAEHEREARQFLRDAAILQDELERASIDLSVYLARLEPPPNDQREVALASWTAQTRPLNEVLPSQVLGLVRAAGMLERDLAAPIVRAAPGALFAALGDANALRTDLSSDLGKPLVSAGLKSGEIAQALRASTGAATELWVDRDRLERELFDEIAAAEKPETITPPREELPPAPAWHFDIETDADGYRWLLRRPDGRVAATSTTRVESRAQALTAARDFVARRPTFHVSQVGPSRFEWRAVARNGETVAHGRVPYKSGDEAERAMEEVRANVPLARIA